MRILALGLLLAMLCAACENPAQYSQKKEQEKVKFHFNEQSNGFAMGLFSCKVGTGDYPIDGNNHLF
ncbi:MAG: hypothetical protein ACLFRF_07610 [Desulfobacterales bacterium]